MNIEKMSKYIEPFCDNRSGGASTYTRRRILISLPRVKWLERQPDYVPWPPLVEPQPEPVEAVKPKAPQQQKGRYAVCRSSAPNDELSTQQRQIWALHLGGLTVAQIATKVGKTPNATSKALAQARLKLGIGLAK